MNNDAVMLGYFKNTYLLLIKVSSWNRLARPKSVSSIIIYKIQSCKHEGNDLSSAASYSSKAKSLKFTKKSIWLSPPKVHPNVKHLYILYLVYPTKEWIKYKKDTETSMVSVKSGYSLRFQCKVPLDLFEGCMYIRDIHFMNKTIPLKLYIWY